MIQNLIKIYCALFDYPGNSICIKYRCSTSHFFLRYKKKYCTRGNSQERFLNSWAGIGSIKYVIKPLPRVKQYTYITEAHDPSFLKVFWLYLQWDYWIIMWKLEPGAFLEERMPSLLAFQFFIPGTRIGAPWRCLWSNGYFRWALDLRDMWNEKCNLTWLSATNIFIY